MSTAILKKLKNLKIASKEVRSAETSRKNQVLITAAKLLKVHQSELLAANEKDISALTGKPGLKKSKGSRKASSNGSKFNSAFMDRLLLTPARIDLMVESLHQVANLSDPVNEQTENRVLPNGLRMKRVRAPLGVIFMIYESRPNVAIEAFSLAFKAGNVMILRGGKESKYTTGILYRILQQALSEAHFSVDCLWGITDPDRKIPAFLLKQRQFIDIVVPRGGDGLINYVLDNSEIPIIKNDRGLCHVYVHEDADLEMAKKIIVNAKVQRPGVCNSIETILIHEKISKILIPQLHEALASAGVQWFADEDTFKILKGHEGVKKATSKNWDTEYLDFKINCRVIKNFEGALEHIELHGSRHSEAIVTATTDLARKFQNEVDAAAVYWNASTRFTDGFEMGLGGELGISTQKLHVRGPVGLRELTSLRWVVDGTGQIRN